MKSVCRMSSVCRRKASSAYKQISQQAGDAFFSGVAQSGRAGSRDGEKSLTSTRGAGSNPAPTANRLRKRPGAAGAQMQGRAHDTVSQQFDLPPGAVSARPAKAYSAYADRCGWPVDLVPAWSRSAGETPQAGSVASPKRVRPFCFQRTLLSPSLRRSDGGRKPRNRQLT